MNELQARTTNGGTAARAGAGPWRLSIPAGPAGEYRLAQLDDHLGLRRPQFPWKPPFHLSLRARASHVDLPGTWGFGFWNDPFSVNLGLGGAAQRLPALPQTAWFFHASAPNYLSLRDDLPTQGLLMATFSSAGIPALALAPGLPLLALLALRPAARMLRRAAGVLVRDDAALLEDDPTQWREYALERLERTVRFYVDGRLRYETASVPRGRLGLILWIDNQYAAFPPDGRLKFGSLHTAESHWIELDGIQATS